MCDNLQQPGRRSYIKSDFIDLTHLEITRTSPAYFDPVPIMHIQSLLTGKGLNLLPLGLLCMAAAVSAAPVVPDATLSSEYNPSACARDDKSPGTVRTFRNQR
jgi:hypothetical protein